MINNHKPFSLLTKKKLKATTVLAVAALANVSGATAISHASEVGLGTVAKGNANVVICHKGRDMQVSISGLIGHIVHGDSIGSCNDDPGGGGRGL